jgi:hypothetical protein
MSIKIKQALTECLNKIESKEFDEETIRTLLIVSREYLQYDGLIKELAHFIAHPKRNKGIFHKKVNARYAKLKLVDEQFFKKDFLETQNKITTEEELSDFMLGGIGIDKIDSKLFDILYRDGLDDLPESHLIKYTGFTKNRAEKFLKESYTKIENHYYLNALKTEKMISLLQGLPKEDTEKEKKLNKSIQQSLDLIKKIRQGIDSLQKVIRGAIHFHSVFETHSISKDFKNNFEKILHQFNIDQKYTDVIENNIQEILVCLMTLMHDSAFQFYDKNIANVYLCSYYENNIKEQKEDSISYNELLYEFGVLALYTNYEFGGKSNSYPLFVSDIKLKDYINREDFLDKNIHTSISEIPWISAKRYDKKLRLETYS